MKNFIQKCWAETDGVLSFEWTLLLTLLVIGIVSGLAGARDAIIDELGDIAHGAICLDQSYSLDGTGPGGFLPSEYMDEKPNFEECSRATGP